MQYAYPRAMGWHIAATSLPSCSEDVMHLRDEQTSWGLPARRILFCSTEVLHTTERIDIAMHIRWHNTKELHNHMCPRPNIRTSYSILLSSRNAPPGNFHAPTLWLLRVQGCDEPCTPAQSICQKCCPDCNHSSKFTKHALLLQPQPHPNEQPTTGRLLASPGARDNVLHSFVTAGDAPHANANQWNSPTHLRRQLGVAPPHVL